MKGDKHTQKWANWSMFQEVRNKEISKPRIYIYIRYFLYIYIYIYRYIYKHGSQVYVGCEKEADIKQYSRGLPRTNFSKKELFIEFLVC